MNMKKYIMHIDINDIKFSIKIIKAGNHMEKNFDSTVENEQGVFRYNLNYWMSYSRKGLRKFAKEYMTERINALLDRTQDLNNLRDKI